MPVNYDLLKNFHVVSISLSVSCLAISFYKEKAPLHINILIIVGPVRSRKLKKFRLPAFYFLLSVGVCSAIFAIIQPES